MKKVFRVDTIVQFRHTYFIEAKSLDHAFDTVVCRDTLEDNLDETVQEFIGEHILSGDEVNPVAIPMWIANQADSGALINNRYNPIYKVAYEEEDEDYQISDVGSTSYNAFNTMTNSLWQGTPRVE